MSITGIPNIEISWGRSNHRFDCAMRITILNALGLRDLSVSLLKYCFYRFPYQLFWEFNANELNLLFGNAYVPAGSGKGGGQ